MNENKIVENLPYPFARHQIVIANEGRPVDYIFTMVNSAFEEATGLKRENIIGRRVTEVLPGIAKSNFDWINKYGNISFNGTKETFIQYSQPLRRWYEVTAYSTEPGFFTTVFRDISRLQKANKLLEYQNEKMEMIVELSKYIIAQHDKVHVAQAIVNSITSLAELDSAALYLIKDNMLHLEATFPQIPTDFPEHLRHAKIADHPHIKKAINSKQPVILVDSQNANLTHSEKTICQTRRLRSILYIPLCVKHETLGVLIVASVDVLHEFNEQEVKLCQTLANFSAITISEFSLYEKQKENLNKIEAKNRELKRAVRSIREREKKNFRHFYCFKKHCICYNKRSPGPAAYIRLQSGGRKALRL